MLDLIVVKLIHFFENLILIFFIIHFVLGLNFNYLVLGFLVSYVFIHFHQSFDDLEVSIHVRSIINEVNHASSIHFASYDILNDRLL